MTALPMNALPFTRTNSNRQFNVTTFVTLAVFFFLCFLPELALAQTPFTGGAEQARTDLLTIIAPVAGIAVIVVGLLAWFGKINWMWLLGLVIGIVLVFGNRQIVTWFRGWFGV